MVLSSTCFINYTTMSSGLESISRNIDFNLRVFQCLKIHLIVCQLKVLFARLFSSVAMSYRRN